MVASETGDAESDVRAVDDSVTFEIGDVVIMLRGDKRQHPVLLTATGSGGSGPYVECIAPEGAVLKANP